MFFWSHAQLAPILYHNLRVAPVSSIVYPVEGAPEPVLSEVESLPKPAEGGPSLLGPGGKIRTTCHLLINQAS